MKKLILLLLVILFTTNVNAISYIFNDDFSGYENRYMVLDDTNNVTDWNAVTDGIATFNDTNYLRFGNGAIKALCQPGYDANGGQPGDTRCEITKWYPTSYDVIDYNIMGRAYFWFKVDNNVSNKFDLQFRTGQEMLKYFSFDNYNQYSVPGNRWPTLNNGWTLGEFDMNDNLDEPTGGTGTFLNNHMIRATLSQYYDVGVDFNISFNKIWLEKFPNAFNNVWQMYAPTAPTSYVPTGWALPNYDINGRVLQLSSTDATSLQKHARLKIAAIDDLNTQDYNFHVSFGLRKPYLPISKQTQDSSKFFFDLVDRFNYSEAGLVDINNTDINACVGQRINNVYGQNCTTIPYVYGNTNQLVIDINGTSVQIRKDGILVHDGNVGFRQDGIVGLDSQDGTTNFSNFQLFMDNGVPSPSPTVDFDETITFRTFSDIAGLIGFVGLLLVLGLVIAVAATIYSQNNGTEINVPQFQTNDLILLALGLVFIIILSFVAIRVVALG